MYEFVDFYEFVRNCTTIVLIVLDESWRNCFGKNEKGNTSDLGGFAFHRVTSKVSASAGPSAIEASHTLLSGFSYVAWRFVGSETLTGR